MSLSFVENIYFLKTSIRVVRYMFNNFVYCIMLFCLYLLKKQMFFNYFNYTFLFFFPTMLTINNLFPYRNWNIICSLSLYLWLKLLFYWSHINSYCLEFLKSLIFKFYPDLWNICEFRYNYHEKFTNIFSKSFNILRIKYCNVTWKLDRKKKKKLS